METGANKDEGQSRRRHKEEAWRSECETTTGKNKNGEKCGWWFVWERILYVDGAFSCVPTLFPCCSCCFPFFFAPLSFVPFTLSSLGAICLPSVSPVMLQMAFVRDVGDHRGFLSIWPWHALLLSLAAWCSTCKSPSTLDPYCWCLADRGPRLSPGAPVVITASPCLEQAATFAFPLDCVSLLPFVEKNCQHSSRPWLLFSLFFQGSDGVDLWSLLNNCRRNWHVSVFRGDSPLVVVVVVVVVWLHHHLTSFALQERNPPSWRKCDHLLKQLLKGKELSSPRRRKCGIFSSSSFRFVLLSWQFSNSIVLSSRGIIIGSLLYQFPDYYFNPRRQ